MPQGVSFERQSASTAIVDASCVATYNPDGAANRAPRVVDKVVRAGICADWEWLGGEGGANLTCSESHRAPHAWPETWVGRRYIESGVLQANAFTCGTTALKDDVGCGPPSDESCDEAPL